MRDRGVILNNHRNNCSLFHIIGAMTAGATIKKGFIRLQLGGVKLN